MATREENLKKINDQLEQLTDDELEKVAGGFYARSNGGEVEKDPAVKIENQSRIIHVTAQAKLGY